MDKQKQQIDHEQQQIDYDYLLEHRIKEGNYCLINTLFGLLMPLNNGVQVAALSILIPILDKEFKISSTQKALISQSHFLGVFFGNIIGGYLADKYGRKPVFQFANIIGLTFSYLSAYSQSALIYNIFRLIIGVNIGIVAIPVYAYLNEVAFKNKQDVNIALYTVTLQMGLVMFSVLAGVCLENVDQGDWRYLVKLSTIILSITIVCNCFQNESIKYQLEKKKFNQAFNNINQAIRSNDSQAELLTQDEKQQLIQYYEQLSAQQQQQQQIQQDSDGYWALLQSTYLKDIIFISTLWHLMSQSYYLEIWMIPVQIKYDFHNSPNISKILLELSFVLSLASGSFTTLIVFKKWFQASHVVLISQILRLTVLVAGLFAQYRSLIFLGVTTPLADMGYSMIIVQCQQVSPTIIKAKMTGIASLCGKVGAIIMPFFMYQLIELDTNKLICYNVVIIVLIVIVQLSFIQRRSKYQELEEQDPQNK